MDDSKINFKDSKSGYDFLIQKKYLILTLFVLVLLILFSGGLGLFNFIKDNLFQ